jgi:hypothetical protein
MRGLIAALAALALALASGASRADEPDRAARPASRAPAPPAEKPRGVCHFSSPGISLVVEDTTQEACHERQVQCQQENPGHEAGCRSQWTPSGEKSRPGKSAKKAERSP